MVAAGLGTGLDYVHNEETEQRALESVKVALQLGADVHRRADNGRTAMHGAAFMGAPSIVQFLADQGAKVEIKDNNGMTPWSLAMGLRADSSDNGALLHPPTADLLLSLGADPSVAEELERRRAEDIAAKDEARESALIAEETEQQ
jgi:hypothetical protein